MTIFAREYLGDGVYATLEENGTIELTANVPVTDSIFLDPGVRDALYGFLGRAMGRDKPDGA